MIYVIAQFACIIYLILNANFSQLNYLGWGILMVGWIIGYLAIINMKLANLNIQPALKDNHLLITHGIYQYIRHPMYASLILQGFAVALTNLEISQWLVYLTLIIVLFLKSEKEQNYLIKRFDNYQDYQKNTGRFLPLLRTFFS